MNLDRIAFAWGASSWHGWGVIGLNLMLDWEDAALSLMPEMRVELDAGDWRLEKLSDRCRQSVWLQRDLALRGEVPVDMPVWQALGNGFERPWMPWRWDGSKTVAFPVFEDLAACETRIERLKLYPVAVAASRWNQDFLLSHGIEAKLCHQGYDPVLFNPGVRRKRDDGRFRVFSGGKAEYRKGQDRVLRAFARFAGKHDDAVLVAAWGSPWPGLAASFASTELEPPPGAEIGRPNFRAWAQRAGIKPHQIEIVPPLPNWRMAEVYGGVDVAVFPNRAEGGTNLVAMEVMACEVPVLLVADTGHKDILPWATFAIDPSYADEDEIVEAIVGGLESLYICPGPRRSLWHDWSWPVRLGELRQILSEV